ncbi:hypothetical protein GCM10023238_34910 [Streptomyces heliomycini]
MNHRPSLWRDAHGPEVLLDLARGADIVFVGEDEAEQAWGVTGGPSRIREALPEPEILVVKQGARGAVVFHAPRGQSCLPRSPEGPGRRPQGDGGPPAREKPRAGEEPERGRVGATAPRRRRAARPASARRRHRAPVNPL